MDEKKLQVAVSEFPPLIMGSGSRFSGFEIDLWEAVAKMIGMEYDYAKYAFKDIIPLLSQGKADIGLAGITIRKNREKIVDFSHPTLDSGLLICVDKNRNRFSLARTARQFFQDGHRMLASVVIGMVCFIVLFGNALWLAERGAQTFSQEYVPGIFEAFWLVMVSMSTVGFGDFVPHTWAGRALVALVIIGGAATFGFLVAQFSAFMATRKIKGEINHSSDLRDKRVAMIEGSSTIHFLERIGAHIALVAGVREAFAELSAEDVDAVVVDAPAAVFYERNDAEKTIGIVGEIMEKQQYGIAMQQNSDLREQINIAILALKESGEYDRIYRKWFGDDLLMET